MHGDGRMQSGMKTGSEEKIDFVLPWVDGSDPEWMARKRAYEGDGDGKSSDFNANGDCRYRDMGLLRYWFRAVERFAPWVNRVFFVTCGQKPEWLDETNPKLHLVDHRDYIPAEHLPTFNVRAINLNLHRIADLSEQFVLFDDDVFLLQPRRPRDFFRGGLPVLPCDLGIPYWLGPSHTSRVVLNNCGYLRRNMDVNRLVWKNIAKFADVFSLGPVRAAKNVLSFAVNRTVIQGCFGHMAQAHLKSTFAEVWERLPEVMERTSRHRFRSDEDVNQWLLCTWNLVTGRFHPGNEKRMGGYVVLSERNLEKACEAVRRRRWPQICLNDAGAAADFGHCSKAMGAAFEAILPGKSGFEK